MRRLLDVASVGGVFSPRGLKPIKSLCKLYVIILWVYVHMRGHEHARIRLMFFMHVVFGFDLVTACMGHGERWRRMRERAS